MPHKQTKICFRVDASFEIGSGHVMRCITLALELREKYDAICYFITRPLNGHLDSLIKEKDFLVFSLPLSDDAWYGQHPAPPKHSEWLQADWKVDAELSRSFISEVDANILVVDHYALDREWEKLINSNQKLKVLAIDDLADRHHYANIVLDYTLNRVDDDYQELVNKDCALLCGLKFAPLRRDFSTGRSLPEFSQKENLVRIFVNMGGIDSRNYTLYTVKVLNELISRAKFKLIIVVGRNFQYIHALKTFLDENSIDYELHQNVSNMSEIMRQSNLAISALGSTTWELLSQGIPCLLFPIAHNQQRHLEEIQKSGLAAVISDLSYSNVMQEISKFIQNREQQKLFSRRGYNAIDAKGLWRVTEILLGKNNGINSGNI